MSDKEALDTCKKRMKAATVQIREALRHVDIQIQRQDADKREIISLLKVKYRLEDDAKASAEEIAGLRRNISTCTGDMSDMRVAKDLEIQGLKGTIVMGEAAACQTGGLKIVIGALVLFLCIVLGTFGWYIRATR